MLKKLFTAISYFLMLILFTPIYLIMLIYCFLYMVFVPISKWNKNHLRKVFFIDPRHVIDDWDNYEEVKKGANINPNNPRPVVVVKQQGDKVKVAKLTKKSASKKALEKGLKSPITKGKFKNQSIKTKEYDKSLLTDKPFVIDKNPLINEEGKISKKDFKTYQKSKKINK